MPTTLITTQPATGALLAAYRRINFVVSVVTPSAPMTQPMYCDIYIATATGSWFYKTIIGYPVRPDFPYYVFDIQDAAQEAIQTYIPSIGGIVWQQSNSVYRTSLSEVFCRFRWSSYDADGILIPDGPIPVQGTVTSEPANGGGLGSNHFYVLNASILPSLDSITNNRLQSVLQLKQNAAPAISALNEIYTLSNLPKTSWFSTMEELPMCANIYRDDYGQLPIIIHRFWATGGLDPAFRNCRVWLFYQLNGVGAAVGELLIDSTLINVGTYYLPLGLKNIAAINSGLADLLVNPSSNFYYHIIIEDYDLGIYCYMSPKFKACTKALERRRVWFQNTYGHFEQVTFARMEENLVTTSSEQFTPYTPVYTTGAPAEATQAKFMGHKRFNIRAHDEYTVTGHFAESLLPWLKELMMSPLCYIEDLDPISGSIVLYNMKIQDGTFKTRKTVADNRSVYEVSINIRQGIDYITLRN